MIEYDSFYGDGTFKGFELFRESFDSPVEFTVREKRDDENIVQTGEFIIDDKSFNYKVVFVIEDKELNFQFSQITESGLSMDDENNLNKKQVLAVFSTVLKIITPWIEEADYVLLEPTTKKKFDVYFTIAKRFRGQFDVVHRGYDIEFFRVKS
jgi:hypothetical protein